MLTREGVDFGILTPPRPIFKFAVAVFDKNTFRVLQNLHIRPKPGHSADDQLAKLAEGQINRAQALHRERFAPKVVPELLAYARSLPEDSRSYAYEGEDKDMLEQATADLTKGLVYALQFKDEYRAAVAMEKAVPYFLPDRNLLPILRALIDECDQSFVAKPLMQEVARATERNLLASSMTIRSALAGIRQEEPETAGYNVR
jgi:hypothetical protein